MTTKKTRRRPSKTRETKAERRNIQQYEDLEKEIDGHLSAGTLAISPAAFEVLVARARPFELTLTLTPRASMVTTFAEALTKFGDEPGLPKAMLDVAQWDHGELLAFHSGEDGFFVRRYSPDIPLDLIWLLRDRDASTP